MTVTYMDVTGFGDPFVRHVRGPVHRGDSAVIEVSTRTNDDARPNVKVIAARAFASKDILEQSPVNFDQTIFADLMADFATKIDTQVLAGQRDVAPLDLARESAPAFMPPNRDLNRPSTPPALESLPTLDDLETL